MHVRHRLFFFFVLCCCCVFVLVTYDVWCFAISCALPPAPRLFSPADAHRMYVEGELVKVGWWRFLFRSSPAGRYFAPFFLLACRSPRAKEGCRFRSAAKPLHGYHAQQILHMVTYIAVEFTWSLGSIARGQHLHWVGGVSNSAKQNVQVVSLRV